MIRGRQLFSISIISLILLSSTASFIIPASAATTWYVGQGLKTGDYFKYNLSWVQWHNGQPVEIDFWVQNETDSGINMVMVAHDGSIVKKGTVTLGYVTPDPTYSDSNISDYANYFKRTLGWLDAFATKETPQDTSNPVWGHTGLFGEVTLGSVGMQKVTVPAGTFNAAAIYFRDSGVDSYIWVDPAVSFPVKAKVYAIKTSGAPTIGYEYDLIDHGNSKTPPSFLNVKTTGMLGSSTKCPAPDLATDSVSSVQTTDTGNLNLDYIYSPKVPHQGCPIHWRIRFEPPYNANQRIPDIHYDIYTVDDKGQKITSLADQLGRVDIYSAVGHDEQVFIQDQPPPVVHYVIYVSGTGPQSGVTDVSKAGLISVDVKVAPPVEGSTTNETKTTGIVNATSNTQSVVIPSWIKNTAKWWAQGQVGDSDFVKGLQYMIQNGIMEVPHGKASGTGGSQSIPSWIKKNAGWWAEGQISDGDFVKGVQYMITNGIITLS